MQNSRFDEQQPVQQCGGAVERHSRRRPAAQPVRRAAEARHAHAERDARRGHASQQRTWLADVVDHVQRIGGHQPVFVTIGKWRRNCVYLTEIWNWKWDSDEIEHFIFLPGLNESLCLTDIN